MGNVNTILQANNIHRIKKAEYDAAKMLQEAHNRKEVARVALADFTRSLSNSLRMEAAGKEYNEAVGQVAEQLEGRALGKLNTELAASERIGALAAQAGAMGVGGSSVDLLSDTIRLQKEVEQDLQEQATTRFASRSARGAAQIIDNAASSTDLSRTFGSFDYTVHIAPKPMKRRLGKLIGVAVATYFGGPAAGQAVADFAVGTWQASNANFSGMAQSFDSGIANAAKGYQTWASLQGGEGPKSWFGAVTQKGVEASENNQAIKWGSYEPGEDTLFGSGFGWGPIQ